MRRLCLVFLLVTGSSFTNQNFEHLFEQAVHYYYEQDFSLSCSYFEQALHLQPNNATLLFNTGLLHAHLEHHEKAIHLFDAALALHPCYAKAHWYRGKSLQIIGLFDKALNAYEQAASCDPINKDALLDLAQMYTQLNKHNESIAVYGRILTLDPQHLIALFQIANEHLRLHNLDQALAYYKKILEISQDHAETFYNIAYTLRLLSKDQEAIPYYRQALALKPDHAQAHFGLSKALLATGDFKQGWQEFEWRWQDSPTYIQSSGHQALTLEMLTGKRILLRGEWGLGDTMQFIRYAQLLKDHGAIVIAQIDASLEHLFALCPYLDELVIEGIEPPPYDYQIPLLSLPRLFQTTLDSIPSRIPYLYADKQLIKSWDTILKQDTNFKIGICWQSKPDIFLEYHPTTKRSIPLNLFFDLARIPGVSLYSLQQKNGLEQLSQVPADIHIHIFDQYFDVTHGRYMDTAAVMHHLDLIISIDTSIVHLSGALGRPTWVLLPYVAEWRWLHDRTDSPWYPSMQLFRQPQSGDWLSVFEQLKEQIIHLQQLKKESL
jgi:tetratricopeptide (TPR) repeat protein